MPRLGRGRRSKFVNLDNLGPKIAEGLTQGASAKEALDEHAVVGKTDGAALVQHMADEQPMYDRIPTWRAVLRDDTHSVWTDETGRLQRNVIESVPQEVFNATAAGHICLRCHEPHPEAFPDQCDVCGYPMRERQIIDVAMEFRGLDFVGPGAPIADYLAEQDERMERIEHEIRRQEGGSPQTAVSRRILSPGVKRLRGLTGSVKVDDALIEKATKPEKPNAS